MTEFAREYGEGLYALCTEERIEQDVLEQLNVLKGCFREQPDFLRLLSNMSLPKQERVAIIDRTLRSETHLYVLNFLKILCERGAMGEYAGCVAAYQEAYDKEHQVTEAVVTTRIPLTEEQRAALISKLTRQMGHQVRLVEKLDPAVTGGVLLEMNGHRYDGTVRHRLESIRRAMTEVG